MILQILAHTPLWVFALFFALLLLGLQQARPRTATKRRVLVLPLALMGLALYGVISAFQAHPIAIAAWVLVLVLVAALVSRLRIPRGVTYAPDTGKFAIPASWTPLAFIMVIFFTRYAINVALARDPSLRDTDWFAAIVGAAYGFSSGYFAGRVVTYWKIARA
ncbi:MAG TPA: DUF6622 family protein [Burkholderiales bacterium]|nr:DUF6622 family protein [Burkholderiales bacterium]